FVTPIRATTVDARKVIVRDPAGRVRLVLGTDDGLPPGFRAKDHPGLFLRDEDGALRAHLYACEGLAGLGIYDPDGKGGGALTPGNGGSGCFRRAHGGAIRVGLALDAADGPRFVIQDEAERPIVSLP